MEKVNQDIKDFVYYMTHNKSLTGSQQARRDKLFAQGRSIDDKNNAKKDGKDIIKRHFPKKTAEFLSLFNRRDGFKYLTHNYDNQDLNFDSMLNNAKKVYEDYNGKEDLPKTLLGLLYKFIYGGEWIDSEGNRHNEGYSSTKWREWSLQNGGMHPITNINGIEAEIQKFRHTIRVVAPDFQRIVDTIIKDFPKFTFATSNLDKADFYANVYIVSKILSGIIKDLTDHSEYKNICIDYTPNFETIGYVTHVIRISQKDSFSSIDIEQVVKKFNDGGGFFYENALKCAGYCNWSVESIWNGKPLRWNILNDNSGELFEPLKEDFSTSFTHILTFYSK